MNSKTSTIEWPFAERREPPLDNPDYLGSKALSKVLQNVIKIELADKRALNILDIGCGKKPFYPFFQPFVQTYVGTDIFHNNLIDIICTAESLAIQSDWADVVLCLSVLEHVNDPALVVKELFRVVKKDGVVFASTHGCFPWHPYPQDHWRWTQTGLPILFKKYGGFSHFQIFATRGTLSGIFFLLAHYTFNWTTHGRIKHFLRRPMTILINKIGEFFDLKTPALRDVNCHLTAIPEFFIIAKKS